MVAWKEGAQDKPFNNELRESHQIDDDWHEHFHSMAPADELRHKRGEDGKQ